MTARVVPEDPVFESGAEQHVWERLREQLPEEAVLIHGLRLSDPKEDREADLVVVWPGVGIAVVEVKGGRLEWAGGRWRQTGQDGRARTVHPVDQARRCKYLIREFLRRHPLWRRDDPRMTHLVAFPATTLPDGFVAPDCDRSRALDRTDDDHLAARVRGELIALVEAPDPPTAYEAGLVVECLTGPGLPQRHLAQEAAREAVRADAVAEHEHQCDLLTAQQARVLDMVRLNRRVEVRGGAGSGKTWLAVEQARRLAKAGERVALLCYSRGLATYLQRRVAGLRRSERPAYVGTFHNLGVDWLGAPTGTDDDSDFWERRLPAEMAALARARPVSDRFDAFVVDEAQDFADQWWPALVAALRDERTGGLFVFADEGQRVFARQGRPPVELVPVVLDENLRNTRQIARTFGSLAPTQMRYRGGDGVPVRFVPCATADAVTTADDEAVRLLEDGWAPEHVALLTTGRRHPVHVEQIVAGHEEYWRTYWDGDDLFFGHVLGFKGLERPAVVLALNGWGDAERAAEKLYVGLSRARDLLVVCGDPDEVARVGGAAVARRLGIAG